DFRKEDDEACLESISRRDEKGAIEVLETYSQENCVEGWGMGDITATSYNASTPTISLEGSTDTVWMSAEATKIRPTSARERKMTREITVTVWHAPKRIAINEQALQDIFPDWHSGSYADAFPELSAVSEGLETIDIKGVAPRIENMEPKGEQNIE